MSTDNYQNKNHFKQFNRLIIKYVPIMILVYLTINLLGLVLPLTMKNIYGNVIGSGSVLSLRILMTGTLVALLFESILKKVKDSSNKWIASVYEYKLTNYMVEKTFETNAEKDISTYISDLEKFNSVSILANYYSSKFYQLIIDMPFMMMYLYLIYIFGNILVIIPIALIMLYMAVSFILTHMYEKVRIDELEKSEQILNTLSETLEKIHVVKGAGIESHQIKNYREKLMGVTESNYSCNRIESTSKVFTGNFGQIVLFAILLNGGVLMNEGLMTFGEVTACAMLGSRAMSPIIHVMDNYHQKREMKIVKNQIMKLLSKENIYDQSTPSFPEDIEGTIEIIDLEYENIQSHQKSNISINIPKGSFVTIDPRGFLSYRSIIRKLYGKEKIVGGRILIDNLDISKWNMNSLKGKMEYIQSDFNIIKGSVLDNVVFYDYSKAQNAYVASSLTGLDELVSQMPEGFETQIDSYFSNQFSSEFLQKLNLTRALVDRPRILILDRLDESMDEETKQYYKWLLESLKGSMTLIVITANTEITSLGTHVFSEFGIVGEA